MTEIKPTQRDIEEALNYSDEDIEFPSLYSAYLAGIMAERKRAAGLVDACIRENPEWDTCTHDYEPNTTMDYFRCEKCGIRPAMAEALAEYRKAIGEKE